MQGAALSRRARRPLLFRGRTPEGVPVPIGIKMLPESLVLVSGRDFKWTFANLDESRDRIPFPAGELFLELETGGANDAVQTITMVEATGGTYTLALGEDETDPLQFDHGAGGVQTGLESLPGIGAGNVRVTSSYTPQWIITTTFDDPLPLSAGVLQAANQAVNGVFDTLEFLAGNKVDLEASYTPTVFTFKLTMRASLFEIEFVDFIVSAAAGLINTAMNVLEFFTGNILDVDEVYAPIRTFTVEFFRELAETPIPAIVPDYTELEGVNPLVDVFVNSPGKSDVTLWPFVIDDDLATLKVEHPQVDAIEARTKWQLVWLEDGEAAGGDPVGFGRVEVQG